MKRLLILSMLLLLTKIGLGQRLPAFKLSAGIGAWREWIDYYDAYASDYRKWRAHYSVGCGIDFYLGRRITFTPEVAFEYYDFQYQYSNTHSSMHVESNLGLLSTRLAPGFTFGRETGLNFRAALTFQVSSGTLGYYRRITFHDGIFSRPTIADKFGRLRNVGAVGPEVNVGYNFLLTNEGRFCIPVESIPQSVSSLKIFNLDTYGKKREF